MGSDGISAELYQVLKDGVVKMMHSICKQIWKAQQWPQDWKGQFLFQSQTKGNAKECSKYSTIALISHTSKEMLKILQATFQQYVNREIPGVQAGFRKGRGISWRRQWHPTPVLLPGKSHGWSSLVGCSPWGR